MGELVGEDTSASLRNVSRGYSYIGAINTNVLEFHGYIDDVRVYDYALEERDIDELMNGYALDGGGDAKYTLSDALDVEGDLYLGGGSLDVSGSDYKITIGGSWFQTGGGFIAQEATVEFDGLGGGFDSKNSFYDLILRKGKMTLANTLNVSNDFIIVDGTLDVSG